MYAVIETGGKQYRVQEGDILDIERVASTSEDSSDVVFDRVLMVGSDDGVTIGNPVVEGAQVHAKRLQDVRAPKVVVFKMKRRKGYRVKNGHRQNLHRVRISGIQAAG